MKLSKRAAFIFPKGFYNIKEWDDSTDVVYLVPIVTEDNFAGYRMTYPDGLTHEISPSHAEELVVSPLSTIEANKMFGKIKNASDDPISYKEFQSIFFDLFQQLTNSPLPPNTNADTVLPFPNHPISAASIWKTLKMKDVLQPIGSAGQRDLIPSHLFPNSSPNPDHKITLNHIAFGLPKDTLDVLLSWFNSYL